MVNRCGDTLLFEAPPVIAAGAAVGGKKESEGPLAAEVDELSSASPAGKRQRPTCSCVLHGSA